MYDSDPISPMSIVKEDVSDLAVSSPDIPCDRVTVKPFSSSPEPDAEISWSIANLPAVSPIA